MLILIINHQSTSLIINIELVEEFSMLDNLTIFLSLQDRSLDFYQLCALYAVTGKFVLLHFL